MKNEIGIFKSIRTKLFLSLCIIVIAIIISLILLNNFVLRKFYEYNKEKQLENVYQTINEYYNEETIELGKEFHYVPGESAFEENSAKILDYLTDIYEIQETLGKTYNSRLFKRQ